jgi:hypothetical protein
MTKTLLKAMAVAALISPVNNTQPSYAQRTAGDYNRFMSYWADNCSTLTPSGRVPFGCGISTAESTGTLKSLNQAKRPQ